MRRPVLCAACARDCCVLLTPTMHRCCRRPVFMLGIFAGGTHALFNNATMLPQVFMFGIFAGGTYALFNKGDDLRKAYSAADRAILEATSKK